MSKFIILLSTILCLFIQPSSLQNGISFSERKFYHKAVGTDDEHVRSISEMSSDLRVFRNALKAIAVERVPGTSGHVGVQKFIKEEMRKMGWAVDEDKFTTNTPIGNIEFNNIIATHNPKARRFLDIACHYDSKYFENFRFIGAIDSAAPCAMMIQIAGNLGDILTKKAQSEVSLRFLFIDGEEAFHTWSDNDSLYGARHLAAKWEREPYQEGGSDSNQLDRMDMLVLLDLLGAKNPAFYNFFSNTQNWYKLLVGAEEKLSRGKLLNDHSNHYFKRMSTASSVDDDHIPFLRRNVPVLHVIPIPFPKVWHKASDTADKIDEPTVSNLIKILSVFISEYLHLNKYEDYLEKSCFDSIQAVFQCITSIWSD